MAQAGNLIVVGTYEQFVLGYTLIPDEFSEKKLSLVQTFACHSHKASVRTLAVGGIHLASGSTDETIRLYDIFNQVESGLLNYHEGTINALAFTENGSHLISAGDDGMIAVVRSGSWFTEKKWVGTHSGSVTGLSVHPSGKLALSIGADNRLVTWNLVKGRKAYITNLSSRCRNGQGVGDVQWSPTGSSYAVFMASHAEVYSVSTAGVSHTIACSNRVTSITFLDDNLILVGEESGEASIHRLQPPPKSGEEGGKDEITRFQAHDRRVKCARNLGPVPDAARDAIQFVTAGGSGRICLWELQESEVVKVCEVGTGCRITCMIVVDLEKELKIKREGKKSAKMSTSKDVSVSDVEKNTSSLNRNKKRKISESREISNSRNQESSSKLNSSTSNRASSKKVKNLKFSSKPRSNSESGRNQGKTQVRSVNPEKWVVTSLE